MSYLLFAVCRFIVLHLCALILPLGPQNIFIFNQGASHKKLRLAMPVVITAALCDTVLILMAVLGVSMIILAVPQLQILFYTVGFLFLIYIGWSIWKSEAKSVELSII